MIKIVIVLALLILSFATVIPLHAFYCGDMRRNLATEGMHKYQILKDCGPPTSKEIVGVDYKGSGSYRIVEEWVYIIDENGHKQMYLLKFDDRGIAVKIEWLGEQK